MHDEIMPKKGKQEANTMPKNRSTKADDRQNLANRKEEAVTPKLNKMSRLPPNLNQIDKNENS